MSHGCPSAAQPCIQTDDATASPDNRPRYPGAVSHRQSFVLYETQTDYLRRKFLSKVAEHGILNHRLEMGPIIPLREYSVPSRSSVKSSLYRLRHF